MLNLIPIFSSYSSSSIAFLLFWPPQCTSMHGPGGNRTPPSPNCHLVHWPQNRPRWPPQMVGELPQMVWFRHAAPQTPYSHFVRNEQLQPSLTAGFRNINESVSRNFVPVVINFHDLQVANLVQLVFLNISEDFYFYTSRSVPSWISLAAPGCWMSSQVQKVLRESSPDRAGVNIASISRTAFFEHT